MNILFFADGDTGEMLNAFRQQLSTHQLHHWESEQAIPFASIEAVIVWQPPIDFFDKLDKLRYVFVLGAGVDQLLNHPGLPLSATVVRLLDAGMARQMIEYTLFGVLHAQRGMGRYRQAQDLAQWNKQTETLAVDDMRVGVLGAGALGAKVANAVALNDYPTCSWSRSERKTDTAVKHFHGDAGLANFLKSCRVLVCLLPLTEQTRGILDKALFDQLPRGAFLINPGRGEHLNETDLLTALDSGQLSGALLDVFSEEPLPSTHPFWAHPNIIVTPHIAAKTPASQAIKQISAGLETVAKGGTPAGIVDRQSDY